LCHEEAGKTKKTVSKIRLKKEAQEEKTSSSLSWIIMTERSFGVKGRNGRHKKISGAKD
jgi:hypothetical protein